MLLFLDGYKIGYFSTLFILHKKKHIIKQCCTEFQVIQLKKNLNQAKIQVIHKLTRKAKTLAEKKCPEHLKEKNKKKAESAVKEVLIMKVLLISILNKTVTNYTII